jgi:hypothetical protein
VVEPRLVLVEHDRSSGEEAVVIHIHFTPTVPHCSLATLIGTCGSTAPAHTWRPLITSTVGCLCIHTHRHPHRHTHPHTDTDIQTHREAGMPPNARW